MLEDPWHEPEEFVYSRTVAPEQAPDKPEYVEIEFASAATRWRSTARSCRRRRCLTKLNELGGKHGIGRLDLVENRFVGMKSRGVYETPGGTILARGASRHREHHARPRRRASQGRAHAALCRAHL